MKASLTDLFHKRKALRMPVLCVSLAALLLGQEPPPAHEVLTNERVVQLTRGGVSTDELTRIVATAQEIAFDLTPAAMTYLSQAGVPEAVIKAMAAKMNGTSGTKGAISQSSDSQPQQQKQQTLATPAPSQLSSPSGEKVRVYVADSESWEMVGGWRSSKGSGSGFQRGGARPQTAEIIKTFNERCPAITITNNKDRANFAVILDHEGGKGWATHKNKIAVFNREGDVIFSRSTRSLGNSVKDACEAIQSTP